MPFLLQLVEHMWETFYGPHSIMLGGVPIWTKLANQRRRGQYFWTYSYEPELAHSHRQHSSIQATTV